MKQLALFAQALADETRWRILQLLTSEALCVCELADILHLPPSSVSSQVQVIKKAGLLDHEKCGKWIYYRLAKPYQPVISALASFFQASPEHVEQLRVDHEEALLRLHAREQSCCPRPQRLSSPT